MALLKGGTITEIIPAGGNNIGDTDGAWFVYLQAVNDADKRCVVTIGRALGYTYTAMESPEWYLKRYYVDGHEYNIVAVKTVKEQRETDEFEFSYMTVRTQIPKVPSDEYPRDIIINQHSQRIQEYTICNNISVMPPFNLLHTSKRDVKTGWTNPKWLNIEDYAGIVVKNKSQLVIHLVDNNREKQFKGELRETYNRRPLINLTVDFGLKIIYGTVNGRNVTGHVDWGDQSRGGWYLCDTGDREPWLYNDGRIGNLTGKFTEYKGNAIMCIDTLLQEPKQITPLSDNICLFAEGIQSDANKWIYRWDNDYEVWMTEDWHTLADEYLELNFNYSKNNQKYLLTSGWYSPEANMRIPYYESGALKNGKNSSIELFVPNDMDKLKIVLRWENCDSTLDIKLVEPDGTTKYIPGGYTMATDTIYNPMDGLWLLEVIGTSIPPEIGPEQYLLTVEVKKIGTRVSFWYDQNDFKDIYVNRIIFEDGEEPDIQKGDFDGNGCIDDFDFSQFGLSYGLCSSHPYYNVIGDFNDDGCVDSYDFGQFGLIFGTDGTGNICPNGL
jgi:hypothetical protein